MTCTSSGCSPLAAFRTIFLVSPSAHVVLLLVWKVGQFLRLNIIDLGLDYCHGCRFQQPMGKEAELTRRGIHSGKICVCVSAAQRDT